MASTNLSSGRHIILLVAVIACVPTPANTSLSSATSTTSDTVAARRLFEANIDAIHKRDRARYLVTYLQTDALARNGPAGLELGYEGWSARRDSTGQTRSSRAICACTPLAPGVVYGTYCYTVTQNDTNLGRLRTSVRQDRRRRRIAVTTAFGLPPGTPAQCK